jgi:hypothetical protein
MELQFFFKDLIDEREEGFEGVGANFTLTIDKRVSDKHYNELMAHWKAIKEIAESYRTKVKKEE